MTAAAAKKEKKTLLDIFKSIDQDEDGGVSKSELQKRMRAESSIEDMITEACPEAALSGMDYLFEMLDVDGDGKVTFAEFEAMLSKDASKLAEAMVPGSADSPPVAPPSPVEMTQKEKQTEKKTLKDLFDSIDVDGNGEISKRELMNRLRKDSSFEDMVTEACPEVALSGTDYLMEMLDVDGDGSINFTEFANMLSKDPTKLAEEIAAAKERDDGETANFLQEAEAALQD